MKLINKKENIFGDNIAFVKQYDFSEANLSNENRILAITQVASICYQSPKALGSESLYNRLMAESQGLPSSSFEFVPMLFKVQFLKDLLSHSNLELEDTNMLKYGEKILEGQYLLTNFRAVVYDFENHNIELRDIFNTKEECKIIKEHFKVFLSKVDMPTRSQAVRHRVNLQELSRRYVSGKRVPFDFYISEKMKKVISSDTVFGNDCDITNEYDTNEVIEICINHYYKALEDGVKPQEARRIIPQACYTQFWMGFQPTQLENWNKLRDDSHAQWEIQQMAKAMKELV
jgi:thymidylate synthase (FAD)